jgi:hypothetical protein
MAIRSYTESRVILLNVFNNYIVDKDRPYFELLNLYRHKRHITDMLRKLLAETGHPVYAYPFHSKSSIYESMHDKSASRLKNKNKELIL